MVNLHTKNPNFDILSEALKFKTLGIFNDIAENFSENIGVFC
jgi:hypothetical protein